MKLLQGVTVTICRNGDLWSNIYDTSTNSRLINDATLRDILAKAQHYFRSKKYQNTWVETKINQALDYIKQTSASTQTVNDDNIKTDSEPFTTIEQTDEEKAVTVCSRLINFFKEFAFEPNFRFVNTLQLHCYVGAMNAISYVRNYFKLTDNAFATSINDKMSSTEFLDILSDMRRLPGNKQINKRFKLYYGSQGTGKTTQAMIEANDNVMVCHSAMLPSDLMEDFSFDDGKAQFKPSALYKAMTEGKPIVLDEINLLPFESLRFLQSLLDGKTQFEYKGKTVNIVDGFMIVGTMNLQVNGITYALPEPLVDRAMELEEFKLTADQLAEALL